MARSAKRQRRLFQFSLRGLLIFVTLVVVVLVSWRVHRESYERQRATMALIERLGGSCKTESASNLLTPLDGKQDRNIVFVDLADCEPPDAYIDAIADLPELRTLVVGGEKFTDEHLRRLRGLNSLRGLVLDSASVCDQVLEELRRSLPKLEVYRSQRLAIASLRRVNVFPDVQRSKPAMAFRGGISGEYFDEMQGALLNGGFFGNASRDDGPAFHSSSAALEVALLNIRHGTTLRSLYIAHPEIEGHDLEFLKRLTDLRKLRFDAVSDSGLAHVAGLKNLRVLWLQGTQITDAGLKPLKNLTKLTELNLYDTAVTDAGLKELKRLTALRELNLRGTRVTHVGLRELSSLELLTTLKISDERVTDATLKTLREIGQFHVLTHATTRIGGRPSQMEGIRALDLRDTRVTDAGLRELRSLKALTTLKLSNERVSDATLKTLREIGLLHILALELSDSKVTDAGLKELKHLNSLTTLNLCNTQVTNAGLTELQHLNPHYS